ncbi:MAG: hypothetical protein ACK5PI_03265 [Acetobacteraceae bacterium]
MPEALPLAADMSLAPRFPMPVERIEKIVDGKVVQRAERASDGCFVCLGAGTNEGPIKLHSLDEVAEFLRRNPRSGVRMNPGWSKISEHIFIDVVPR